MSAQPSKTMAESAAEFDRLAAALGMGAAVSEPLGATVPEPLSSATGEL